MLRFEFQRSKRVLGTFAWAVALCWGGSAAASVVTFDDVAGGGNAIQTSINSGGFVFTSTHFHVTDDPGSCSFGGCVQNGTQYGAEDAPTLAGPVTMARQGGGTFSLASFDGAELWLDDAAAAAGGFQNASLIRVVGDLFGGGTIAQDFVLDGIKDGAGGVDDFQSFLFGAGWTNLVSATFEGRDVQGSLASIAFDNINANGNTVPEPASLVLVAAALGLMRRRRTR